MIHWTVETTGQLGANMFGALLTWGPVGSTAVQSLLPPSPHPPPPRQTHFHAPRPAPPRLMLPPPHSQESQAEAEAVTVGPSAGNFLWTAGNNLTWGLDSAELSWTRPNIQGRQLVALSRPPREIPESTLVFPPRENVRIKDQKLFRLQKKTP